MFESGKERPGPNFAGRYIVVQWGCGTECIQYAIVDAKTGMIRQPPVPGKHLAYFDSGLLDYRLASRLMFVKTNCERDAGQCDSDFYVIEGARFRRVFHTARTGRDVR